MERDVMKEEIEQLKKEIAACLAIDTNYLENDYYIADDCERFVAATILMEDK